MLDWMVGMYSINCAVFYTIVTRRCQWKHLFRLSIYRVHSFICPDRPCHQDISRTTWAISLGNLDETYSYKEHAITLIDDPIRFRRSKVKSCEHRISWTTWAISMKLTWYNHWAPTDVLVRFWRSKVKCQGHWKLLRWQRHRHWDTEVHLLAFSDQVYPTHGVHRSLLGITFSGGANRLKLITSFTQTKVVITSFKATRPQKLSPLVTTGLLGVNRHFQCKSTQSPISALAELVCEFCLHHYSRSYGSKVSYILSSMAKKRLGLFFTI